MEPENCWVVEGNSLPKVIFRLHVNMLGVAVAKGRCKCELVIRQLSIPQEA